jgi:predicted Zn-dependent protease
MNRLEMLRQFAKESPDDPFNLYAMALEYLKSDPSAAADLFQRLIETRPDYLPTYYPYAQLLIDQNRSQMAELIFHAGMNVAKAANDHKTYHEIQSAFNDWMAGV